MKLFTKAALLTTALFTFITGAQTEVSSWVPYYYHTIARDVLLDSTGDYYAANTLTQLGLQFWLPEIVINGTDTVINGNIVFDSVSIEAHAKDTIADRFVDSSDVAWFVNWGNENGVKTMLCLAYGMLDYNKIKDGWALNWEMQKRAFHDNQEALINSLLRELDKYDLDGIDIDLEGVPKYREEYRGFIKTLSDSVKVRNKPLSIAAAMNTQWLGVNPDWWEDYVGLVDKIGVMGYTWSYEGCEPMEGLPLSDNKYTTLYNHGRELGYAPEQISLGLPGWADEWGTEGRGAHYLDHLEGLRRDLDSTVSVCIWDITLQSEAWQTPLAWQTIALLNTPPALTITSPALGDSIALNPVTEVGNTINKWPGDQVDVKWDVHSSESVVQQEISLRYHLSNEWIVLDTISAEEREYSFDASPFKERIFTVRVSQLDESGKMIDYDKSDGYVKLVGNTSITTAGQSSPAQFSITSQENGIISLNHNFKGDHQLKITDLRGREIFRTDILAGVNNTRITLPLARGVYVAAIEGAEINSAWKVRMK